MAAKDIRVRWEGQRKFVGTNEEDQRVNMDAPVVSGGEGTAPSPLEMLLHGLAGCTGMDIVSILEKKRQPLEGLTIEVHAEKKPDGPPSPYQTIDLVYVIDGEVSAKAIDDAVALSYDKYCSAKAMLSDDITIHTAWRYANPASAEVHA